MIPVVIIVLILAALLGPQMWARHVLDRYNRREYFSGNGFELARLLLEEMNMTDVRVEASDAADHYDPETGTVRLTRRQCGRRTLTAVVVAAHEVGHAVQDHTGYRPLVFRNRLVKTAARVERIGAVIVIAVPLVAMLLRVPSVGVLMFLCGLATLGAPLAIHLLTLPTELDASFHRALPMLTTGRYIPEEDIPAARQILLACALTYVANALYGLLNVWRWIRILRR